MIRFKLSWRDIFIGFGVLTLIVWLLNDFKIIEMTPGIFVARFWPLIISASGLNYFAYKDRSSRLSGLVMITIGVIFLILNIEFLIVEEQSVILQFFQNYFLILLPVVTIILGIIVIRWITFTGEEIFRTMFWKKNYEITKTFTVDSTFKSYFGKTIVSFQEDEIGFRLMRLDLQAFFGSVVVEVPENIAVRGEARGLLCRVDSFGKKAFYLKGTSLIDQPANLGSDVDPEVLPPRIVINSKLIFGSLKIKRI